MKVATVSVVEANPSDFPGIAELSKELYLQECKKSTYLNPLYVETELKKTLRKCLKDKSCALFVAKKRGSVIGFTLGEILSTRSTVSKLRFDSLKQLFVKAGERRGGTARKLIEALSGWFSRNKVHILIVSTRFNNRAAKATFRACGFREEIVEFWKPL